MSRKSKPLAIQFEAHALKVLSEGGPTGFMRLFKTFRPPYAPSNAGSVLGRLVKKGKLSRGDDGKYALAGGEGEGKAL